MQKATIFRVMGALVSLVFSSTYINGTFAQQVSVANPPTIGVFDDHIKQYMKLHEQAVKKVPRAGSESKPDKIEIYQEGLAEAIRASRTNAKQGDIFAPEIAAQFRRIVRDEFKGQRLKELKATTTAPEVQGAPLRINYPYPDSKELVDTPPTLLLKLPQLPKQLGYHFAGRRLLLIDRESRIIVDYIPDALP